MPKKLTTKQVLVWVFLGSLTLIMEDGAHAAPAYSQPQNCAGDNIIEVCVTSASLSSGSNAIVAVATTFSVTLRIVNKSDYPIGLALRGSNVSFDPENAPSITCASDFRASGIMIDNYMEFPPNRPTVVHISCEGFLQGGDVRMVQSASIASFSATLAVSDRGNQRLVPLSVPEFHFGNGFSQY